MSPPSPSDWLADRTRSFDSSGIRKVFDLAAQMTDPVNLSIGQPDFSVPEPVRDACIDAIQSDKNGYALTQGIPPLRECLQSAIDVEFAHDDRHVFVTSGTSGGLSLAMWALVNPGDEVIIFDPYFVMYAPLVSLVGATPVLIDTYPDFEIDMDRVRAATTDRTKMILLNSPANPTGAVPPAERVRELAEYAQHQGILLLSDEIYRRFCFDTPFVSPATYNPSTLVIDGFSKSHAMTGWRVGWAHGPQAIVQAMTKLQQYTFVCAPQPAQWAALTAWQTDTSDFADVYRQKRDRLIAGIQDRYEIAGAAGAFYVFPRVPWGNGSDFVAAAIRRNLLIIPGNIFSQHDSHFRVSYAADDQTIDRGIEILNTLAEEGPNP